MKRLVLVGVLLLLTGGLGVYHAAPTSAPFASEPHSNCCLCMCHAKDETKCSAMCIRLQHGTKIVEEPEMNVCTKECERHGVEKTNE
jgi:hypothetical protein